MAKWKPPLKVKVYEAFSVIADGRYEFLAGNQAKIASSNGQKSYLIEWQSGHPLYITSNDNGTYYKGYAGYPIIAILMAQGKISYNPEIVKLFAAINWNALNKEHNNDYDAAVESLLEKMKDITDISAIREEVENILKQVQKLNLHKLDKRRTPPR